VAVASLRLVSPGAATYGVTYFFLKKMTTFFSHRPLQSDLCIAAVSLPIPPSHVYPDPVAFFLNSAAKKYNFIRVSPPPGRMVSPGAVGPPLRFP